MKHNTTQRQFYIDFIRSFSLLVIILCHFDAAILHANPESSTAFKFQYKNFDTGSLGVALFVMVSGASLMLNYGSELNLRDFYYRRFLSIFPMFWMSWVLGQGFNIITAGHLQGSGSWRKAILTITGFDGFFLYAGQNYYIVGEWFIGMIICLYVIFPILRYAVIRCPLVTLCVTIALTGLIHRFYVLLFTIAELRNPVVQAVFMVFGMVFVRVFPQLGWKSMVVSLAGVIVVFNMSIKIPYVFTVLISSAVIFCAIALIGERLPFDKTTRAHVVTVAKYSYPAFLMHHILINWLAALHPTSVFESIEVWWVFFIAVTLALAAGYMIHRITHRVLLPYFPTPARRVTSSTIKDAIET